MALIENDNLLDLVCQLKANMFGASSWLCALFSNNVTPAHTQAIGAFTEIVSAGLTAQGILTWGTATTSANVSQVFMTTPPIFINSSGSPVTVYGYIIRDAGGTKVFWAERDPVAPITLNPGDTYTPLLQTTYKSEF